MSTRFFQVEGIWDSGTLKPPPTGAPVSEAAVEAEDSYDDSFDDGEFGSSGEDGNGEAGSHDTGRPLAEEGPSFQAPPASSEPLYDVTSSQFVVHVQQQPSSTAIVSKLQGPIRPLKVKKTAVPSFVGLKLRLKVRKRCSSFLVVHFH